MKNFLPWFGGFFFNSFFFFLEGDVKNPAYWDLKLRFLTSKEMMKSIVHIKNCPCLVLLLPKPLLFRNHDCVNMKPGHINCSCFQRGKKKKTTVFSRLSVFVLRHEAELLDLTLAKSGAFLVRLTLCFLRSTPARTGANFPLHPHLFLAAALLKHSGSSSYFYVTTSANSFIVFPIFLRCSLS